MRVALDSRLVQPGDYFVPVKGENSDGHDFIDDALARGAAGIVEENKLYELASKNLRRVNPIVIAVTGSVGKTTMRGFVATILATKCQVAEGKLNTKLGLASNIIHDVVPGTKFFVAETGMDRVGELRETGEFIKPHAAIITNISETHLEKLGSVGEIQKAKAEILQVLPDDGVAFLNWDNQLVREIAGLAPRVASYGLTSGDVTEKVLPDDLPIIGRHNRLNAVGAYAVGQYFGLSRNEIETGLTQLRSPKGRFNRLEGVGGATIFDDTYNSAPVSASCALESVAEFYSKNGLRGRKIAVLGGMLELGEFEGEGHREVGERVAELGYDVVVLIGPLALKFKEGLKGRVLNVKCYEVEDSIQAGEFVRDKIKPHAGDVILFKASQGIRLEKAVAPLLAEPSRATQLLVRQDARWQ